MIDSSGRLDIDLGTDTTALMIMQNAATVNGNGVAVTVDGYNGAQILEIFETAGGTGTVSLQGSMDGAAWMPNIGYQQTDGQATPTRSVQNIGVGANSRHFYQILDPYKYIRCVISSIAGNAVITARVYAVAL